MEPNVVVLAVGSSVPDLLMGVTAVDGVDGDLTESIIVGGDAVDTNTLGTYTVTYDVTTDVAGNVAIQKQRFYQIINPNKGTPGLPFIEDFSSDTLIDKTKTTADFDPEEQAVRLAWENRQFGALKNPAVNDISGDRDDTQDIAIGDVDGDGDLDLVVGNSGVNKLYLNTGLSEAPFANTVGINITDDDHVTSSISLGDVDGDGHLDVVAGNIYREFEGGGWPNRAYLNNGSENPFADVTGINISDDDHDTSSIALGDVDGDGDLDVVAGNSFEEPNRLYLNNGTADPFADVTGISITDDDHDTQSIALGDMDGDGDLDVIAGNDARITGERTPDRLYLNIGSENPFADVTGINISDDDDYTQSIALGDVDGDGDLDVVAGNSPEYEDPGSGVNRLYLNNGTADPFANVTGLTITDDDHDTSSIALGDVDSDGDLDLVAGNSPELEDPGSGVNRLYLNNGSVNPFANVTGINITDDDHGTLSIALGDVDGDGDLDVVAGNSFEEPHRLYLNNGSENPFADVTGINITDDDHDPSSIALGDVDGDGDLDLVAGNFENNRVYFNNGSDNPFTNGTEATVASFFDYTAAIAVADVNGDHLMDMITGNQSGPNYVYFLYSNHLEPIEGGYQTHLGSVMSPTLDDRSEPIFSAILTALADMPENTGIDFYLSNNGGQNWYRVQSGKAFVFPTTGSDLRWKAELQSLSPAVTPVLHSIAVVGNSAATDIILSQSFIAENREVGEEIGSFEVVDIDEGSHNYALVDGVGGDDNEFFMIEDNILKSNAVFDFENGDNKRSYSIRVRVTDEGGGFFEKQFTIGVSDVNDPPTDIVLSANTIIEELPPGAAIGILTVIDIDLEDIHLFNLPEGVVDNDRFAIDGDLLLSNESFDFEARDTYIIRVQVTDGGGKLFEKEFSISIEDGSDAPDDFVLSPSSIVENQDIGAKIGMFTVIDIDSVNHTFTLVDGPGDDDNADFRIEGADLKTNSSFDFETKSSYSILVLVTDEAGNSFEKQFTLGVSDANDPPDEVELSNQTIEENRLPGAFIGSLSAEDEDTGDAHFFSLPEERADNALFAITGFNELRSNIKFNFEERDDHKYVVVIQVTDGGGASIEGDFEILVTDKSDSVTVDVHLSEREFEDFTFGKNLTVTANILSDSTVPKNADTLFRFLAPDGEKKEFTEPSSEAGLAVKIYAPEGAGPWELEVDWAGTSDLDPGQSNRIPFTVQKADTILELFFLGVPQVLGQGRTIPGRLVLNNGNPGNLSLSGLEISVSIGNVDLRTCPC